MPLGGSRRCDAGRQYVLVTVVMVHELRQADWESRLVASRWPETPATMRDAIHTKTAPTVRSVVMNRSAGRVRSGLAAANVNEVVPPEKGKTSSRPAAARAMAIRRTILVKRI